MKTLSELKNIGDKEQIGETKKNELPDPPMVVVLKRKAIRMFPSGKRVALYHNDKLGIDISIPYSPTHMGHDVAGIGVSEELLFEKAHDDLFGDYTNALKKHYGTGARHTDHPELLKMKQKVIGTYGRKAFGHFHAAADHYLNGNPASAMRHYEKFERNIDESYEETLDEAVIHKLHHITKTKQAGDVSFKNGATARVEYPQAAHIIKLHTALTPDNKQKVEGLVNSSPAGLEKVANFASEHLK